MEGCLITTWMLIVKKWKILLTLIQIWFTLRTVKVAKALRVLYLSTIYYFKQSWVLLMLINKLVKQTLLQFTIRLTLIINVIKGGLL